MGGAGSRGRPSGGSGSLASERMLESRSWCCSGGRQRVSRRAFGTDGPASAENLWKLWQVVSGWLVERSEVPENGDSLFSRGLGDVM